MKKATRILALLLTLVLVVGCFAACGGDEKKSADQNNPLIGTWVTTQEIPAAGLDMKIDILMDLNANGKIRMYVPDESLRKVSEDATENALGALSEEDAESALKAMGYSSKEAFTNALYTMLKESMGEDPLNGFWTSDEDSILIYETEEAFKAQDASKAKADKYTLSEDGKTLSVSGKEFTKK